MPPKFFITHSWKDNKFARKLCDDLRRHGLDGFFDEYSIQPGEDIAVQIAKGLEDCDVYIPLLSPVAVSSKWCELEISTAINLGMDSERDGRPRIIPVMIESCKLPTLLRGRLYINSHGRYDDALNELLTSGFAVKSGQPKPRKSWLVPFGLAMAALIVAVLLFIWPANTSPVKVASFSVSIDGDMKSVKPGGTITVPLGSVLIIQPQGTFSGLEFDWDTCQKRVDINGLNPELRKVSYQPNMIGADCVHLFVKRESRPIQDFSIFLIVSAPKPQ